MRPFVRQTPLLLLAVVLLAAPAVAETFTIELVNGSSFVSRHQPQEASWDPDMVLFMTEHGNWIALARTDIADVTSTTETKGFGRLINTTTIDLGWAPNDEPLPDADQGQLPLDVLQSLLQGERPSYDQQQFVSPSEAGGGLPLGYATGVGGGGGTAFIPYSAIGGAGGRTPAAAPSPPPR